MENNKIKIVFMGTPEFGAIILERLCQSQFNPILVITAPDKPVGRRQILTPPPVKLISQKYNLPVYQPININNSSSLDLLKQKEPDLIVVAAYGQILSKEILKIPKYGGVNVHPSLLPKYRGPTPIQFTILSGDKETGVTIILMDEKMDHGNIIVNSKFEIRNSKITYGELLKDLANLGANLLVETIPKWIKGEIKPIPQDDSKATYTKIIKKEDGKIDWKKNAEEIERQIRAFDPWPGSFTFWEGKRIKILKARVLKALNTKTYPIGKTLVAPQNELCVQCGKDFLVIEGLKLEGKKEMASEEFLRGHPDFIGTILK